MRNNYPNETYFGTEADFRLISTLRAISIVGTSSDEKDLS